MQRLSSVAYGSAFRFCRPTLYSDTLCRALGHAGSPKNFFLFRSATSTALVYNAFLDSAWTSVHKSSGCGVTCCLLSRPLPGASVPFYLFNYRELLFGALPSSSRYNYFEPGQSIFHSCQTELCKDYHEIFFKDHNYCSCKDIVKSHDFDFEINRYNFKIDFYKLTIKVHHRN